MAFSIGDAVNIGTGIADFFGGKEANKANVASNATNVAAQAANQEKGLQALTGGTDFGMTTRNADGGFDTSQVGGGSAASVREAASFGDKQRMNTINALTSGAKPTFNSLQDAIAFRRGDVDAQKGEFNRLADDSTASTIRRYGAGNSNFGNANRSNLYDLNKKFDFGENVAAQDLYNKQSNADSGNLLNAIRAQSLQAPAHGFNTSNVGGTAANVIAQSPPQSVIPDLGSTVGAAAFGNAGRDFTARMAAESAQANQNKFLQALIDSRNQGNQFNTPSSSGNLGTRSTGV